MKPMNKDQQKRRQNGQSLVEMAIMLVVLITILAGVLDLGRAYYVFLSLQDAAGEGAIYGSMFPDRLNIPNETGCAEALQNDCANPNNVVYRTQNESPSDSMIDWSNTVVTTSTPDGIAAGNQIKVTIAYEYEIITPVIEAIAGDTITLEATAVNTIVGRTN